MNKHLWEADHDYYCNDDNYFNSDCLIEFESWEEYIEERGDEDHDCNLIFRWDWLKEEEENEEESQGKDKNYRDGLLKLYYMAQRKGIFQIVHINVRDSDEEKVRNFLVERFLKIKNIWNPIV